MSSLGVAVATEIKLKKTIWSIPSGVCISGDFVCLLVVLKPESETDIGHYWKGTRNQTRLLHTEIGSELALDMWVLEQFQTSNFSAACVVVHVVDFSENSHRTKRDGRCRLSRK